MMSGSNPTNAALFFFLIFFMASFKLSFCIGNSSSNTIIACPEIEKQALVSFKQSLKDPSNLLSSWNNNGKVNCCKWKGVFCNNLTGHVIELHLQNISGIINPSLLNLNHLKYLDLSQNQFNETMIPSFIGSLTSLEYLNLSFAGFYGKIPHTIGNLSNLHTLVLEDSNSESLEVDSLEWLSRLSKLEHLNMNYVNLSKAANWAQVINNLPSLIELHLSSCNLNDNNDNIANNITNSLAIIDLSSNNFQSFATPRWIFQLTNLIFLDLTRNFFEGPIPTTSNTTKLRHINLYANFFNSTIPEWLYFCKDLGFFSMGLNHLQGIISNGIANLTSLHTLDLLGNELSGIPKEIGNLCKMQSLDLSWNKLQGEISNSFGNMSNCFLEALEYLDLSENQLSGGLTRQFGEFKSLRYLSLGENSLCGEIPKNLGNLSSLEYLSLGSNKLTGNLPESMGQLFKLQQLYVYDNMLEGVVTETHFAHLSNLTELLASRNNLTLKVSPNWIPPFKLQRLQLRSWNLGSGSRILSWLETQKKYILELDLSSTGISGSVPSWLLNIRALNLSNNQLCGNIPVINIPQDGFQAGTQHVVYLSSNNFSGPLPIIGNTVTELDLSNNSFSGDIFHFLCDATKNGTNELRVLHLGRNHLSGELPEDCLMKWPSLTMLNLGYNNFSGKIPNSIGSLTYLQSLNLYGNKFSGHIPFSMQNCKELLKIDLSDNNLDGNIPTWMGTSLSKLLFVILRSNKLSGEITSTICRLNSIRILDLSDNNFFGTIPRCVNNFTAMTTTIKDVSESDQPSLEYSFYWITFIESASVTTKGSELHYDTILRLVTNIDLSKNNLSGDIPKEITSLVELRSLNLSGNHLTGLIPDSIGNMKQLESLDFSRNSLSGEIPSSFTIMSSLSYLNLSCNNLTGKIPESTQLLSFNESSFIGNNLCGPPLTSSCGNDGKSPGPRHKLADQDEEDDKSEIECLSGKINPSLLNLKHLRSLDLSQNNFEETIPFFIGSLTSLEYLNLSGAGFYGKIPHNIGNLSNLHTLVLKDNSESLEVDSLEWLSGLTKLDHLNMNSVNLNKATNWAQVINKLPSLVELHFSFCSLNNFRTPQNNLNNNITSLAILDLSGNFFQSFGVFQLSNLIFLDLNFNFFEGPIPSITNISCKLQHIDLSNNLFNSTIPEWLYFCKGLEFVSLGLNHLQGTISKSIANMTSLKTLDLSRNELSGKIPREITNLCKMQSLDLHQNNLAGEISDSLGNMSDCFLGALEYLSLSQNQLSGHLTHQFGEFKSLRLLDLISNSLSSVIPNNLGNLSCLEFLYLSRNKLTGNLPESMGQLSNLKYFYISDNMLEGVVTETHFAHLSKLKGLYASTNQLTLKVVNPNWIPPFKLDILNLRSWNLGSGSGILSWIETQNNNMNHLDLSTTGISGNVPSWIWNIRFLNLSHNQLHGNFPIISEPEDGYQAGSKRVVYLSSNNFSGSLPIIGNTVTELDLSNNSFSGDISHFLCDTTTNETNRLEILHLGGNNLSGELPAECLMKWSSLKVLNLGNNYLFGRIPNSIGFLSSL
ncbi:hypothetical protein DH2020_020913 [Rehmannia glutinosa]|uniref:Uncharacterized protein n=1 Tax=Rehmannia glutinosa TaxID=99300 RepID=A0ABR0WB58_REHGL